MKTFISLFSGGGLVECGAKAAGYTPIAAVEYDAAIADVYRANHGDHITVARVEDVNPMSMPDFPDLLWASPVCKNFSQAKTAGTEQAHDLTSAQAVCRFLTVLKPPTFILENVQGYRLSKAFGLICATLDKLGYWWTAEVVNAADFGVPQTRRRLILRASRDGLVLPLPQPAPWVGWYQAIADLIPALPDSQFAPWQLARLPDYLTDTGVLVDSKNANQEYGKLHRLGVEPSITVTAIDRPVHMSRAFIVDGQPNNTGRCMTVPHSHAPMYTLSASMDKRPARAFIVEGSAAGVQNAFTLPVRLDDEPVFTMRAQQNNPRAFLVEGQNASRELTYRDEATPSFTIGATSMRRPASTPRAWLSQGRVVSMTPRALARFQAVPDDYLLPASNPLACTVIGNGVPSLLAKVLIQSLDLTP